MSSQGQGKFSSYMNQQPFHPRPVGYNPYPNSQMPANPMTPYPQPKFYYINPNMMNNYNYHRGKYQQQQHHFNMNYAMQQPMYENHNWGGYGFNGLSSQMMWSMWCPNDPFLNQGYGPYFGPSSWYTFGKQGNYCMEKYPINNGANWLDSILAPLLMIDDKKTDLQMELELLDAALKIGGFNCRSGADVDATRVGSFGGFNQSQIGTDTWKTRGSTKAAASSDDVKSIYWLPKELMDAIDGKLTVWEDFCLNGVDMGEVEEKDTGNYRTPIRNLSYSGAVRSTGWREVGAERQIRKAMQEQANQTHCG